MAKSLLRWGRSGGARAATIAGVVGVVGVVGLIAPGVAWGHALESSLERVSGLTDTLMLQSRFSTSEPARDAAVRLVSPTGKVLRVGRTDADGSLSFRLPRGVDASWELQVDQGPGHRDYLELPGVADALQANPLQATLAKPGRQLQRHGLLDRGGRFARGGLPLALAGLVVLGGLGGASLRRRWRGRGRWQR